MCMVTSICMHKMLRIVTWKLVNLNEASYQNFSRRHYQSVIFNTQISVQIRRSHLQRIVHIQIAEKSDSRRIIGGTFGETILDDLSDFFRKKNSPLIQICTDLSTNFC